MTAFAAQVASAGAMQVLRAIPAAIGWAVIVLAGLAVLAAGLAWLACRANPLARVLDEAGIEPPAEVGDDTIAMLSGPADVTEAEIIDLVRRHGGHA